MYSNVWNMEKEGGYIMIGIVMTTVLSFLLFLTLSIIVYVKNRMRRKKIMKTTLGVLIFGIIVMFFVVYAFMPTITVPNMLILNVIVAVLFVPLVYGGAKVPVQYQTMHRSLSGIIILGVAVAVIGVFIYSILALQDSYDSISKSEEEEARPLKDRKSVV